MPPLFNASELREVAARCDALIKRDGPSLEKVAISWLHVLSEHPTNVDRYCRLLQPAPVFSRLAEAARGMAQRVRTVTRSAGVAPYPAFATSLQPADIVLISHLVNKRQLDSDDDFYFGPMQVWLEEKGLRSLLVLRNHLAGPEAAFQSRVLKAGPRARVLLPRSASWAEELDFRDHMRAVRSKFRNEPPEEDALSRAVKAEATRQALTESSLANLRLHRQIEQICRVVHPRVVMATYEGHAWERCAWNAARRVDANVRCVGYQHTVLWQNSHAARRSLGGGFDPDMILTVGEVTQEMLSASPDLGEVTLSVYGSHRRQNTSFEPIEVAKRPERCLVLPEGLESECVILFEFAIESARLLPEIAFAFRLHPVLSLDRLKKKYAFLRSLPANVELSVVPAIEDDFRKSRYCLYRGSSSVIYAILAGLKPFYVARDHEIPFDPLFRLGSWREVVSTPGQMVKTIRSRSNDDAPELYAARDFCNRYVVPAERRRLDSVLRILSKGAALC